MAYAVARPSTTPRQTRAGFAANAGRPSATLDVFVPPASGPSIDTKDIVRHDERMGYGMRRPPDHRAQRFDAPDYLHVYQPQRMCVRYGRGIPGASRGKATGTIRIDAFSAARRNPGPTQPQVQDGGATTMSNRLRHSAARPPGRSEPCVTGCLGFARGIAARCRRAVTFAGVGALGAVLKLALMYVLTDVAGLHYMVSYGLSFCLVVGHNYVLNSHLTFRRSKAPLALGKFALVSLGSAAIRAALVFVLTDVAGLWYIASTAVAIAAGFIVNYVFSLRWVWVRPTDPS